MQTNTTKSAYVYLHKDINTGEVIYIGKGTGTRAYRTNRTTQWYSSTSNGLFNVTIVEHSLSDKEALKLESNMLSDFVDENGRLPKGNLIGAKLATKKSDKRDKKSSITRMRKMLPEFLMLVEKFGYTLDKGYGFSSEDLISMMLSMPTSNFYISESEIGNYLTELGYELTDEKSNYIFVNLLAGRSMYYGYDRVWVKTDIHN